MNLNAVVTERDEVAPGLMVMRVEPDGWDLRAFEAGQFAVLGLPPDSDRTPVADPKDPPRKGKMIRRAYSIASSSKERRYLEFYITLVRSGALTPRLFALQPGDRLWLGPKITGAFTLEHAPQDKDVVFVATGTGLAPYMSMLRTVLNDDGRRYVIALGARHSWDLGYHSELVTLDQLNPRFAYLPIISRPSQEEEQWSGPVGYVMDLFDSGDVERALGHEFRPENSSVFLCGNPAMIDDMSIRLNGQGFREHSRKQPGEIFVERYW